MITLDPWKIINKEIEKRMSSDAKILSKLDINRSV